MSMYYYIHSTERKTKMWRVTQSLYIHDHRGRDYSNEVQMNLATGHLASEMPSLTSSLTAIAIPQTFT